MSAPSPPCANDVQCDEITAGVMPFCVGIVNGYGSCSATRATGQVAPSPSHQLPTGVTPSPAPSSSALPSSTLLNSSASSGSSGLSTTTVAIIGAVAGLVVIAAIFAFICCRRRKVARGEVSEVGGAVLLKPQANAPEGPTPPTPSSSRKPPSSPTPAPTSPSPSPLTPSVISATAALAHHGVPPAMAHDAHSLPTSNYDHSAHELAHHEVTPPHAAYDALAAHAAHVAPAADYSDALTGAMLTAAQQLPPQPTGVDHRDFYDTPPRQVQRTLSAPRQPSDDTLMRRRAAEKEEEQSPTYLPHPIGPTNPDGRGYYFVAYGREFDGLLDDQGRFHFADMETYEAYYYLSTGSSRRMSVDSIVSIEEPVRRPPRIDRAEVRRSAADFAVVDRPDVMENAGFRNRDDY
ncbi:hypothetical protein BDK51DRAFT_49194 [Blyttiomyces helicus]|uniref:Uncharacterized protein n=1 Tax=Blyttiomyces helicus TaxID=388810 RepID=A0A4P9W2K7_9FUNG|nr:hypothetical protein BDK51DRAFT_49194 [Blyttiomyces helicus]|eukprot:RKO84306.1 hypothetical protein BDK51DRAFT_49194 [Blyttiomyces helicus]